MEQNPYQTPTAAPLELESQSSFYVVGITKFICMTVITCNLYLIYWFYRNWSLQKPQMEGNIWPAMRGLFSIFFTHSLFARISAQWTLKLPQGNWDYKTPATLYVVISVVGNLIGNFPAEGSLAWLSIGLPLLSIIVVAAILVPVQRRINEACGIVSEGDTSALYDANTRITFANAVWLLFGALLWVSMLLGVLVLLFPQVTL